MDSLPERIEAAEGPSRELDADIAAASGWVHRSGKPWAQVVEWERPAYTASIDAAMTLVPGGWGYRVWLSENRKHASATVDTSHPINRACFAESNTPALALCAAALRAKEQPNEG